jgi:type I restriction enzyme S subunit
MAQNVVLPDGWNWATLDEACNVILGQSPPSDTYNIEGVGLPFYQGKAEFGELYPTKVKWCSAPGKIAEAGDVLITVRAPVGPTNLCQEKSCIGRGLAALRPKNGMPNKYLLYYLRFIEKEWDSKATGTTFKAITGNVLRQQEIPLAPLPEQERIVAKIEELFTQLEAGKAALRRAAGGAGSVR